MIERVALCLRCKVTHFSKKRGFCMSQKLFCSYQPLFFFLMVAFEEVFVIYGGVCALVTLYVPAHFPTICFHRAGGEVGCVEGIHRLGVVFLGVSLWQQEWFGGVAVVVDGGEIHFGVEAVAPSAGEEEPVAVGCPAVQALRLLAVGLFQGMGLPGRQIIEPQVALGMPDGEIAVVGLCVHDVFPVV